MNRAVKTLSILLFIGLFAMVPGQSEGAEAAPPGGELSVSSIIAYSAIGPARDAPISSLRWIVDQEDPTSLIGFSKHEPWRPPLRFTPKVPGRLPLTWAAIAQDGDLLVLLASSGRHLLSLSGDGARLLDLPAAATSVAILSGGQFLVNTPSESLPFAVIDRRGSLIRKTGEPSSIRAGVDRAPFGRFLLSSREGSPLIAAASTTFPRLLLFDRQGSLKKDLTVTGVDLAGIDRYRTYDEAGPKSESHTETVSYATEIIGTPEGFLVRWSFSNVFVLYDDTGRPVKRLILGCYRLQDRQRLSSVATMENVLIATERELISVVTSRPTLVVKIVDEAGRPVSGVSVVLTRPGQVLPLVTLPSGEARVVEQPTPSGWTVRVSGAGIVAKDAEVAPSHPSTVEVQVKRTSALSGTVIDDSTGKPVRRFRVRWEKHERIGASSSSREGDLREVDSLDGRFSLSTVPEPPFDVVVEVPWSVPQVVPFKAVVGSDIVVRIAGWTLDLMTIDEETQVPIAGVHARLASYVPGEEARYTERQVAPDGRTQIRGIPTDAVVAEIRAPGYAAALRTLTREQPAGVIALRRLRDLTFLVEPRRDDPSRPFVSKATVLGRSGPGPAGDDLTEVRFRAPGRHVVSGYPPGRYCVGLWGGDQGRNLYDFADAVVPSSGPTAEILLAPGQGTGPKTLHGSIVRGHAGDTVRSLTGDMDDVSGLLTGESSYEVRSWGSAGEVTLTRRGAEIARSRYGREHVAAGELPALVAPAFVRLEMTCSSVESGATAVTVISSAKGRPLFTTRSRLDEKGEAGIDVPQGSGIVVSGPTEAPTFVAVKLDGPAKVDLARSTSKRRVSVIAADGGPAPFMPVTWYLKTESDLVLLQLGRTDAEGMAPAPDGPDSLLSLYALGREGGGLIEGERLSRAANNDFVARLEDVRLVEVEIHEKGGGIPIEFVNVVLKDSSGRQGPVLRSHESSGRHVLPVPAGVKSLLVTVLGYRSELVSLSASGAKSRLELERD